MLKKILNWFSEYELESVFIDAIAYYARIQNNEEVAADLEDFKKENIKLLSK